MSYQGEERRTTERRGDWRRPPTSIVTVYVIICVFVVAGFFIQGANSRRIEREGKERVEAICRDGNERSRGIRGFINDITPPERRPVGVEAKRFQELLDKRFPIKDCTRIAAK